MIDTYKKVSIIYGVRGKKCACIMADLFSKYYSDYIYPIKAELLAEQYLNCENVIKTIKDIIESSDICVILLTFDDINNTRVRQNILIELGMTMVLLKASQCYFFSEKIPLPEDFPSDFKHSINPNYFNPEQPEGSAEKIVNYILGNLKIASNKSILTDNNYIYDHEEIFRKLHPSIYDLEAETQMQQILIEWIRILEAFDYVAERSIYILERCIFLPLFTYNDALSVFFTRIHELIRPSSKDYHCFDKEQVNAVYKIADNILEYIERNFVQSLEKNQDPNAFDKKKENWSREFSSIAGSLEQAAYDIKDGTIKTNWYLYIMACDYAGLARMRAVRFDQRPQIKHEKDLQEYKKNLQKAMDMFDRANVFAQKYCIHSHFLWEGYIQYNISRIYELLYDNDRIELYRQGMRDALKYAIDARKRTINKSHHLKGVFSIALTSEYFWALNHEYEIELKWPEVFEGNLNDIARKIENALAELNIYCDATGLKKLYDVRDDLRKLLTRTKTKHM